MEKKSDLSYSLKEYMDKLEHRIEDGFEQQTKENNKIYQRIIDLERKEQERHENLKQELENKYALKSSVNRVWVIIWSVISFGALYVGKMLIDLLTYGK